MGLRLDEGSLGIAAGHARAEAQYERRGCSCADGVPDEPKGRRETGDKEAMKHAACIVARIAICIAILLAVAALPGCSRKSTTSSLPKPTTYGAALVESSGGKQTTAVGTQLPQPVVVQV